MIRLNYIQLATPSVILWFQKPASKPDRSMVGGYSQMRDQPKRVYGYRQRGTSQRGTLSTVNCTKARQFNHWVYSQRDQPMLDSEYIYPHPKPDSSITGCTVRGTSQCGTLSTSTRIPSQTVQSLGVQSKGPAKEGLWVQLSAPKPDSSMAGVTAKEGPSKRDSGYSQ